MTEGEDEGFSEELTDFRRRVEELRAVRALPAEERLGALDAALVELQHAADVLWPRFERWSAARGDGRGNSQEQRLLRALFQRMPVAVALVDREAVVRRMNFAATQLFGARAGYATGRTLTGWFRADGRAALRSQIAAVARGEGGRVLLVRMPRRPGADENAPDALWVTLGAIRPPDERQFAVLAVFQPADSDGAARGPATAGFSLGPHRTPDLPDLAEVSRQAEVLDLVDDSATTLLATSPTARPETVARRSAQVLHRRFADWVIIDWVDGRRDRPPAQNPSAAGAPEDASIGGTLHGTSDPGHTGDGGTEAIPGQPTTGRAGATDPGPADAAPPAGPDAAPSAATPYGRMRRLVVCGPDDGRGLVATVAEQDPSQSPLVVEAVRTGASTLRVRPEEVAAFGLDASGAPLLVSAEVTSLLCVPLRVAGTGPTRGVLTLFRTGARRAFEMAEAGAADRMARHLALALHRAPTTAAEESEVLADGPGGAEPGAERRDVCLTAPPPAESGPVGEGPGGSRHPAGPGPRRPPGR